MGAGGWKAARTRSLERLRYVAQAFLPAGSRGFPAPFSQKLEILDQMLS
jgi:hypothetical protein